VPRVLDHAVLSLYDVTMKPNQYLTIEQITETLNLGTRAVMNLVRRGELPSYRFGDQIRIDAGDLAKFIEASRVQAGGQCFFTEGETNGSEKNN